MTPAWARDFNNAPRHCWEDKHGDRWLQGNGQVQCTSLHDPKLVGATEWMRFIRWFGVAARDATAVNPFTADDKAGHLLIEHGHTTSDGRPTIFCETYLRDKSEDDWGVVAVFRVFLNNDPDWARIECYDNELVGLCEIALGLVEKSYGQEVTR
jgi:hypothetical protein